MTLARPLHRLAHGLAHRTGGGEERSAQLAGTLSGGEQQMLAIGRALMARPKVLMLDEPSLGAELLSSPDVQRAYLGL